MKKIYYPVHLVYAQCLYYYPTLGRVKLVDIKAAARRLLPEFLSEKTTQTVIVCNPASIGSIVQDFRELGIELKSYETLEDTFLVDGTAEDFP